MFKIGTVDYCLDYKGSNVTLYTFCDSAQQGY